MYTEEQHWLREPETKHIATNKETVISAFKVEKIQKKLKNRKTTKKDGIVNKLLKYDWIAMTDQLTALNNKILYLNRVQEVWKQTCSRNVIRKNRKSIEE